MWHKAGSKENLMRKGSTTCNWFSEAHLLNIIPCRRDQKERNMKEA